MRWAYFGFWLFSEQQETGKVGVEEQNKKKESWGFELVGFY